MDLQHKPLAIKENKIITLNMHQVSVKSTDADDNGAFISKGSATSPKMNRSNHI